MNRWLDLVALGAQVAEHRKGELSAQPKVRIEAVGQNDAGQRPEQRRRAGLRPPAGDGRVAWLGAASPSE